MTGSESLIWLIPAALSIIAIALLSLDKLLLLVYFFAPLSVQLSYLTGSSGPDLSVPTEPVLAIILFITIFKMVVTREFSHALLKHPLTVIIFIYLTWTLVTSVTSSVPVVSLKTLAYRMWFIAGFYLLTAQLILSGRTMTRFLIAYSAGLFFVVLFFLAKVAGAGFLNQKFAHSACYPFYRDHTSFGASIAFLLPVLAIILFKARKEVLLKMFVFMVTVVFSAAFIFSYSRAAWVSLIAAMAAALILWLRMPQRLLAISSLVIIITLFFSAGAIWQRMDSTTEDSSADLGQHLRSSSNITTDQSNLERINRWKSALRMFADKPLTGWGPGTYQFKYAPYQKASEKTPISTDFGDAGNAHSEYLGALSESGLPGAALFLTLVFMVLFTGVRCWYHYGRRYDGYLLLALVTGLITYAIHGLMNSFLDSDKIAALWWGLTAMIAAADIRRKQEDGTSQVSGSISAAVPPQE